MGAGAVVTRQFPWTTQVGGERVTFRLMTPEDQAVVLAFVRRLPEEDLYYLINDIRDPAGMNRWIADVRDGSMTTVLAEGYGQLLGYSTLRLGQLKWTRHMAEMRIMVAPEMRGKGIGRMLGKEIFAVAHDTGLRRIFARVTSHQATALRLFGRLGFHIEATLADCVINDQGRTEDMIFLSYDVAGFHG
jgi:L-amino acid N-acyltransferase YncA